LFPFINKLKTKPNYGEIKFIFSTFANELLRHLTMIENQKSNYSTFLIVKVSRYNFIVAAGLNPTVLSKQIGLFSLAR
jgi:hypothetical protein